MGESVPGKAPQGPAPFQFDELCECHSESLTCRSVANPGFQARICQAPPLAAPGC